MVASQDLERLRAIRGRLARTLDFRRRQFARDIGNLARFGRGAPLQCQLIWVDPSLCTMAIRGFTRRDSAKVLAGTWDLDTFPIQEMDKVRFAQMHWVDGVPWEETGAYDLALERIRQYGNDYDGLRTMDEVVVRHERLDRLFQEVRKEGRLRTRAELSRRSFREQGGVFIHVDREASPVFGRGGCHRLVIAQILGLQVIPAQIGAVHKDVIARWRPLFT